MTNDSVDEQISVVAEVFDHFEVEVSHRGTVVVCLSDDLQMELPAHGALIFTQQLLDAVKVLVERVQRLN
jgi:hypothetical protein